MSCCSLEAHSLNCIAKRFYAAKKEFMNIIYWNSSFTRCSFMGATDLNGKELCPCASSMLIELITVSHTRTLTQSLFGYIYLIKAILGD